MTRAPQVMFPIAVDPQALRDHPSDRERPVHVGLERVIREYGILALEADGGDELGRAISELGSDSRDLWNKLVRGLDGMNRLERSLISSTIAESIERLGSATDPGKLVRLLVAGERLARSRGVGFNSPCLTIEGTDLVVAATVDKSSAVVGALGLDGFAPGTARNLIADSVLSPLGMRSGIVTMFDPHLFDNVLGTARSQRVKAGNSWVERMRDHVEWLVTVMSGAMPPGSTLQLIGDFPTQKRTDGAVLTTEFARSQIEAVLGAALSRRTSPITVRFTLVRGPKPGVKVSNRFLLFDCGVAFLVDHDLARLGTEEIQGPEDFLLTRLDGERTARVLANAGGYIGYEPASARVQGQVEVR